MADTTRHAFFCQDDLWQSFMELAAEKARPVDDLICEAMSQYMRNQADPGANDDFSRQPFGGPEANVSTPPTLQVNPPPAMGPGSIPPSAPMAPQQPFTRQPMPSAQASSRQPYGRQPAPAQYAAGVPAQPPASVAPSPAPMAPPPAPMAPPPAPMAPPPAPMAPPPAPMAPPMQPQAAPPIPVAGSSMPIAPSIAPPPASNNFQRSPYDKQGISQLPATRQNHPQPILSYGSQPPLYIIFANQKYTVDKDKFIIGRSSQMADLVIRDGNISRKHCAIIFKNGAYYIKDLDSTNGIEYKGNRIDTKKIEEGDKYNICEFQFTFTYQA